MKRLFIISFIFVGITGLCSVSLPFVQAETAPAVSGKAETGTSANAKTETKTYTWKDKLQRGGWNMLSSPVEVSREIQVTSQEKSMSEGWTTGLVKGLGYGFQRFGAGAVDVFTSPFDWPKKQKAPLIDPEYVWEKPGVKYK